MKGHEIKQGGTYLAKVSGSVQAVRVEAEVSRYTDRVDRFSGRRVGCTTTNWICVNLATGRRVVVRSAQRFRGPAA